jgi:phage-related protein
VADDEIRVSTSMDAELEAALARLDARLSSVEDSLDDVGRAGRMAGEGIDEGMGKATRATDKAKRASQRAAPPIKDVGDEALKTGTKARVGATGVDKFADKMQKAQRSAGGLGSILTVYKWAGIATGLFALAGGASALGAGAVIAVGGLAPMVGILGTLPGLYAAARLSMLAFTLAGDSMEATLTRIKTQFTDLGPQIAKGGLGAGMSYFADSLDRVAAVSGKGLSGLGAQLGAAAHFAGNLVKSPPILKQISAIFTGLRPVVRNVTFGLIELARALLNIIQASLPVIQQMAQYFRAAATSLRKMTAEGLRNGKLTAFMTRAWDLLRRTVGVLVDILVGLFNIFRLGSHYATDMGMSIEDAARRFRAWTESASGQARINRYFQDSLPALREMGRLLGKILSGFGGMAANANVAPLIKQINDELAPAVGRLVSSFASQGGLGPALISAAAALADLFAQMDFSALTLFAQAIATIARWIIWISVNVPGAGHVISALLGAFLGFKLMGPIFGMIAGGAKAFSWISKASKMTGELTVAQKYFGGIVLPMLRTLASFLLGPLKLAITGIGIALKAAFVTTPVGWIILAIAALVAGVIYAWNHFAWFRDAVIAVWNAIKTAAVAVANFFVGVWQTAVSVVMAVWNALRTAWLATVNFITTVAMWIWDHGLGQVIGVIVAGFKIAFAIVAFIVQTAVYIIMAIVTLLAVIFQALWTVIAAGAMWLWNTILHPIVVAFQVAWQAVVSVATMLWQGFVNGMAAAWNWFYNTIIAPVINVIRAVWTALVNGLSIAWQGFVSRISAIWNGFKSVVSTVVGFIRTVWSGLTSWLSGIFRPVGNAISAVFTAIGKAASVAGNVIKGIWDGIMNVLKGVWNFIARIWNSIPSVTVPDWVPIVGGTTFGLPKMPILYAGGPTPGGPALVGEHGPEPYLRNGRMIGMLGANGPEIANLPRGGYVLPNLATLASGMAKSIPAPVASAVARAAPAYASAGARHDPELARAISSLAARLDRPPLTVHGNEDTTAAVLDALRTHDREQRVRGRYDYEAGEG